MPSSIKTTTDYHVLTATGGLIKTFEDRKLARKCAAELDGEGLGMFPGCYVDEIEVTTVVRTVYRPSAKLRVVA